uniref:TPX2 C-terminal domain-containing protein n=1 Tax=Schistocephalus solidus TaxID=70667 RepID=A0A0X3PNE8_SCHSO
MAASILDRAVPKRVRHSSEASTQSSAVSIRLQAGVPFQGSRTRSRRSEVPSQLATAVPNAPSSQAYIRVRSATMRSRRSEAPVQSTASVANTPLTHRGVRVRASMTPKITQPKPFTFESRDKAALASRERRVAAELETRMKLANSFRAQPMPVGPPDPLPSPRPISLTAAASPNLQTRKRAVQRRAFEDMLAAKRASLDKKTGSDAEGERGA